MTTISTSCSYVTAVCHSNTTTSFISYTNHFLLTFLYTFGAALMRAFTRSRHHSRRLRCLVKTMHVFKLPLCSSRRVSSIVALELKVCIHFLLSCAFLLSSFLSAWYLHSRSHYSRHLCQHQVALFTSNNIFSRSQ